MNGILRVSLGMLPILLFGRHFMLPHRLSNIQHAILTCYTRTALLIAIMALSKSIANLPRQGVGCLVQLCG